MGMSQGFCEAADKLLSVLTPLTPIKFVEHLRNLQPMQLKALGRLGLTRFYPPIHTTPVTWSPDHKVILDALESKNGFSHCKLVLLQNHQRFEGLSKT